MKPYALKQGEGNTYNYGIPFTVKSGELHSGRGVAVMEYTTRQGEEPNDHTHKTEDEIFYVLAGELTFRCGDETFAIETGGFIYLPMGIKHGYTIRSTGDVRLMTITFPPNPMPGTGWGGFIANLEKDGELVASPSQ